MVGWTSVFLTNKQICTLFEGGMLVMRNVALDGAVSVPDDSYCQLQTTLLPLLQETFLSNIKLNTGLQSARCESMLLLPHGVQAFLSILWIWGLNSCAWACASALYVCSCCCSGYQFPFSLVSHLPVPQGCPWHRRASRMVLSVCVQALQLSSRKTEQWSFLAGFFPGNVISLGF